MPSIETHRKTHWKTAKSTGFSLCLYPAAKTLCLSFSANGRSILQRPGGHGPNQRPLWHHESNDFQFPNEEPSVPSNVILPCEPSPTNHHTMRTLKLLQQKKEPVIVPSRSQVFLSRATSPCSSYLKSSCVAWSYQRAVISLAPQTSSAALWATMGLISAVLPEKDPWPPGLQRPRIDLSLVLLLSASPPLSPWALLTLSPLTSSPLGSGSQCHGASSWISRQLANFYASAARAGLGWRPEAYGCLSVCLGEMLFSELTRCSCCNKSMQQIQTALLPWHPYGDSTCTCVAKVKGMELRIEVSPILPRNRWTSQSFFFLSYLFCANENKVQAMENTIVLVFSRNFLTEHKLCSYCTWTMQTTMLIEKCNNQILEILIQFLKQLQNVIYTYIFI